MSNARVSQQYVEILAQNPSKTRVTQQYVEVLTANATNTVYEESANSSLNLSDSYSFEYITSVTDSLNVTDSNTVARVSTLESSINFTDELSIEFETSVTDALSINDSTQKEVPFNYHLVDSLELSLETTYQKDRSFSASSTISLTDAIVSAYSFGLDGTANIDHQVMAEQLRGGIPMGNIMSITDLAVFDLGTKRFPESELDLTDNVEVSFPYKGSVSNHIRFDSDVFVQHAVQNYSLESELDLQSGTPIAPFFTDTLNITDEAVRRWWPITDLGLTETVIAAKAKNAESNLSLTQTLATAFTFSRSLTSEIENLDALTYYTDGVPCAFKSYTPFMGASQQPFRETIKPVQRDSSINRVVLAWPTFEDGLKQVVLRAPEIDDISRYSQTRSYKETRGGSVSVYSDPIWPKIHTLVVTFIALSASEVSDFEDFVYATLGKEIDLGDWNGYIWRGIITNPEEPIIEDGKRGFTISFQFEGNIREDDYAGQSVSLTDSTDYEITKWFSDDLDLDDAASVSIEWGCSAHSYITIWDDYNKIFELSLNSAAEIISDLDVVRVRLVEDTACITDIAGTLKDCARYYNDTLTLLEDANRLLDATPESDETLNISDSTSSAVERHITIIDSTGISDEAELPLYPVLEDSGIVEDELVLTVQQLPA